MERDKPADMSVKALLEWYRDAKLEAGVRAPHTLKNSVNQVIKVLGRAGARDVNDSTFTLYAQARSGQGIKNNSILRELGVLKAAICAASKIDWLPFRKLSMPVQKGPPREKHMSRPEYMTLLKECEQTPHLYLFSLIAIASGHRKQAICELRWHPENPSDGYVDLDRNIIHFGKGHGNKRRGVVPVDGKCLTALRAAYAVRTERLNRVIEWRGQAVRDIKGSFKKACARAGIEYTPHTLRHTAATWMVEAGISYEKIGRHLGMTPKMVEEVYGHHSPKYLKDSVGVVSIEDDSP